jgi:hypothetical protein
VSIVPLAGPHHRSMGAELDGLFVKVLCLMDDADAFHGTIPPLETNTSAPGGDWHALETWSPVDTA